MSIASEIARLRGVKADILRAISDKGVVVPAGSALDDCPGLIASISGGGAVAITIKRIDSEVIGLKVVDENGYVGDITDFKYTGNIVIVVEGADYSQSGLGRVTFITPGSVNIGGRTYRTVNIGGVTWLAENLDFKFSGVAIGPAGTPSTPAAWYYNNDEVTYGIDGTRKCGLLYNWIAVKLLEDNKSTLCPGWHVPTNDELTALFNAVGGLYTAGTKLKAANVSWATSWGGTDDYGFAALPAGNYYGRFISVGSYATFWSITESGSSAYSRYFDTGAAMHQETNNKTYAYSVRLVKDS